MKKSEATVIWAEEQVAMLQPLLNIPHWRVTVEYEAGVLVYAETYMHEDHRDARIVITKLFVQSSKVLREQTMIHELLHVQHDDGMSLLRGEVKPSLFRAFWKMEEKAVDDMAWTLHKLIYGAS